MKHNGNATLMTQFCCLSFAVCMLVITGCANITTRPLHEPLYPSDGETVTFNLKAESPSGIQSVQSSHVDSQGRRMISAHWRHGVVVWNDLGNLANHRVLLQSEAWSTSAVLVAGQAVVGAYGGYLAAFVVDLASGASSVATSGRALA